MNEERDEYLPDFGQQVIQEPERYPWLTPIIGGLAWLVTMLMILMGKAPWQ